MADNNAQVMEELNNSINDLDRTIKGLNASILGEANDSLATSVKGLTEKVKKNEDEFTKFGKLMGLSSDQMKRSFSEVSVATQSFGRAMLDTTVNFSKFGKSITEASRAIEGFGAAGRTIGLVLKPITMFVEAILGSTDAVFEAKDSLSKMGTAGRLTYEDISKLGRESGFSVSQLKEYTKIIKGLGPATLSLGTTVADGVIQFTKLTNVTNDQREAFQRLGISHEELAENQADYIRIQSMSSVIMTDQFRRSEQLKKASLEYTENLLVLSSLTGQDIETIKKKQEQQLSEVDIQARWMQMSAKARDLELEGRKKEAESIRESIDQEQKAVRTISTEFGPTLASAMRSFIATGGELNEVSAPLATLGIPLGELTKKLREGKDVSGLLVDETSKAIFNLVRTSGTNIAHSEELRRATGITSQDMSTAARRVGVAFGEQEKAAKDAIKANKDKSDQEKKDPMEAERNRMTTAMIQTREQFDKMVLELSKKVLPELGNLASGFTNLLMGVNEFGTKFPKLSAFMDTTVNNLGKIALTAGAIVTAIKIREATKKTLGASKDNPVFVCSAGGIGCSDQSTDSGRGRNRRRRRRSRNLPQPANIPSPQAPAGGAGKILKGGARVLGKIAAPLAIGMALYDAYGGFGADGEASFGEKLKNAGSSALSGLSFGLLGSSPEEIRARKGAAQTPGGDNIMESASAGAALGTLVMPAIGTAIGGIIGAAIGTWGGASLGKRAAEAFDMLFGDTVKEASQVMPGIGSGGIPGPLAASATTATAAAVPPGMGRELSTHTNESLREMGLRIKRGDVQKPGAVIDPKTIEMAKRVQAILGPELAYFSGFNDVFHQENAPRSMHTQGRAFDFVLSSPPTPERSRQIQSFLRTSGAVNVIDEYANPSSRSTGGHFHVQTLAKGGIANGPITGFPAELHGRELVTPISPNSLLEKMATTSVSNNNEVVKAITNTIGMDSGSKVAEVQIRMMDMISNKLDNMIGKLSESNDIQEKLLQYTRA